MVVACRGQGSKRGRRTDAVWVLTAPDGVSVEFVVEVKARSAWPRELPETVSRARPLGENVLIVAPYLSPRAQEVLRGLDVSFADTTGNVHLVAGRPGVFVERQGASRDPWPVEQTLQSLRGRSAGRAVRALVDFSPPFGVRALASRAGVPLGSLSRVLDLLDREGLVTREARGTVCDVDWEGVIRRWSQDYEFARSNHVATLLEPRGLGTLAGKLGETVWVYAATGAFAVQRFAPVTPARQATAYVEDVAEAAEALGLRPADVGANVVLAEPYDPVVFERGSVRDGLGVVAPSQLAVDLLSGVGREPVEGAELLGWMRRNESEWRT